MVLCIRVVVSQTAATGHTALTSRAVTWAIWRDFADTVEIGRCQRQLAVNVFFVVAHFILQARVNGQKLTVSGHFLRTATCSDTERSAPWRLGLSCVIFACNLRHHCGAGALRPKACSARRCRVSPFRAQPIDTPERLAVYSPSTRRCHHPTTRDDTQ